MYPLVRISKLEPNGLGSAPSPFDLREDLPCTLLVLRWDHEAELERRARRREPDREVAIADDLHRHVLFLETVRGELGGDAIGP